MESVGSLVKEYENICRYSAHVLNKLESNLEQDFDTIQEIFFVWKKRANDVIEDCRDVSGEELFIESWKIANYYLSAQIIIEFFYSRIFKN